MTKKIKFITGLSCWSKTTCIQKLLGASSGFQTTHKGEHKVFSVGDAKTMALQFSNCAWGLEKYIDELGVFLGQYESKDYIDFALVTLCCSCVDDMSKILNFVEDKKVFDVELVFLEKHWNDVAQFCVDGICERLQEKGHRF